MKGSTPCVLSVAARDAFRPRNVRRKIRKVKAHQSLKKIRESATLTTQQKEDAVGNDLADRYAKKALEQFCTVDHESAANQIRNFDAQVTCGFTARILPRWTGTWNPWHVSKKRMRRMPASTALSRPTNGNKRRTDGGAADAWASKHSQKDPQPTMYVHA